MRVSHGASLGRSVSRSARGVARPLSRSLYQPKRVRQSDSDLPIMWIGSAASGGLAIAKPVAAPDHNATRVAFRRRRRPKPLWS